ncbi:hypothetical protein GTR02_03670 [Kineococcus sp. R8]|nr:hypothetical protein [Kineococcus siccus]
MGMLTGCSTGYACPAMYEYSGVTFDLTEVVDPAAGGTVRLCADGRCEGWDVATRDMKKAFVSVGDLEEARAVRVSARVTDAVGSTTFEVSGQADLQQYPPDGPVCQENLFRAAVRADAAGDFTAVE